MHRRRRLQVLLQRLPAAGLVGRRRAAGERPRLHTHQSYLEDITNETALPLSDQRAMLTFVLESLPDRVKVYPTENYYYFTLLSTKACATPATSAST